MMKGTIHFLILLLFLFSNHYVSAGPELTDEHIATCMGSRSCYACKNCKYCKYCNAGGGSCGVCTSSSPVITLPIKSAVKQSPSSTHTSSSQCKGITKKGARCKRTVSGGGYCWQHD